MATEKGTCHPSPLAGRIYADHEIQSYVGRISILLARGQFSHARGLIDQAEDELPNQWRFKGLLVDQPILWAIEYAFWRNGTLTQKQRQVSHFLEIGGFKTIGDILRVNKKRLQEVPGIGKESCQLIEQMMSKLGFVWPIVLINDLPCSEVVSEQTAMAWQKLGVLTMRDAENRGLIDR